MDELEAQLQSKEADLKSARKRIEQLHGALKDHEEEEEYSGDEDDFQYNSSRGDSLDNLSSEESSYGDQDDSLDDLLSESNDDDLEEEVPKLRAKRHLSPVRPSERKRSSSKEPLVEDDEYEASRKARQRRLKELEEEERELEASRKARKERMKDLEAIEAEPPHRTRPEPSRNRYDEPESPKKRSTSPPPKAKNSTAKKTTAYDSDDDDDLEEFLLKQRERMKNLEKDLKEDDDDSDEPIRASKGISTRARHEDTELSPLRGTDHVSNGKANGVHSTTSSKRGSREASTDLSPHGSRRRDSVEDEESHAAATTSRYRRKRQRRRTIEQQQLTSPEHKANGVDL